MSNLFKFLNSKTNVCPKLAFTANDSKIEAALLSTQHIKESINEKLVIINA